MIKLYLCRAMTNRVKEEVVKEAQIDKAFFEAAGFEVLCPVAKEEVQPTKQVLLSSKKAMQNYWPQDKRMIRTANIILDMSPTANSEGVKHEIGYGRYCLWKPIVRVFPENQLPAASSVAYFEDDAIVDSNLAAVEYILRKHGTRKKRILWRLKMLNRSLPKWLLYQLQEFFK